MADGTLYEQIGAERLHELVTAFYQKVAVHPDLAPIFPPDLTETTRKQYMFLSQFFGGPPLYTQEFGHPMMRARHLPFPITPTRARAWLSCMSATMDEVGITGELREAMLTRLAMTAQHMINTGEEGQQ